MATVRDSEATVTIHLPSAVVWVDCTTQPGKEGKQHGIYVVSAKDKMVGSRFHRHPPEPDHNSKYYCLPAAVS